MDKSFLYELNNKTLVIKQCPNNTLNYILIRSISEYKEVENIIIGEGIEKIAYSTFNNNRKLKSIKLPSSLEIIEDNAFSRCTNLRSVKIPEKIKRIHADTFSGCARLTSVYLPPSVEVIAYNAFRDCKELRQINLDENVEYIGRKSFSNCSSLSKIKFSEKLKKIEEYAFEKCTSLKKLKIPEGIEEIRGCFTNCENLVSVELPKNLKVINKGAFANCYKLNKIVLPENLEVIGRESFSKTNIYKITIPKKVKKIEEEAFSYCKNLLDIKFNDDLKKIQEYAFLGCFKLMDVSIPDSVEIIESCAFRACSNLRSVSLPSRLRKLENDVFSSCYKLRNVEIKEGTTHVELGAFDRCNKLLRLHFPSSIKKISREDLRCAPKLEKIYLIHNGKEKEIDVTKKKFIRNSDNLLLLFDASTMSYSFYKDGKYVEFYASEFEKNLKIRNMVGNGYIGENHYIKLYYWLNKKIIPSSSVIKLMPTEDVNNFFVNRNCNEWAKLLKESEVENYYEGVSSFFKLCYVLGVFSESTSLRDKAVKFIKENIIGKLNGGEIHEKFDGFDLSNRFDKEYSEFFMKYYSDDFMSFYDEFGQEINLICSSYNNFKQVKKVYPNKTIHTNRISDLLLPIHVANAVRTVEYQNIDEGNEEFAYLVGNYGYNQEQFETLQEWYNRGKSIEKYEMRLFVNEDEKDEIFYELLRKDDPRGAILGNITNCCQVLGGAAEECVEHGMTSENSGFITFNYKDKIIAQSWIWYDEKEKAICLDNIEVPHKYIEKINEKKEIKESFINCLLRLEENLKKEMKNNGFEVYKVTIGEGYNDLKDILDKKFEIDNSPCELSDYTGYSDAKRQYKIKK